MWNQDREPSFAYALTRTARGWCAVAERGRGLWRVCLPQETPERACAVLGLETAPGASATALLEAATDFLTEYFRGADVTADFDLDLNDQSDFSRRVLAECARVPRGDVVTYGTLATRAGAGNAARAVGGAMHQNPLPVVVPCHRVVGSDGRLTGFGGGLELKALMLRLEGVEVAEGRGGLRVTRVASAACRNA